jgi:hypothetical protein
MCRSGRMFAPTKIWRKWHVKINQGQKYVQGILDSRGNVSNNTTGASLLPRLLLPPLWLPS